MSIAIYHPVLLFVGDTLMVAFLACAWAAALRRRHAYDAWAKGTATVTAIRHGSLSLVRTAFCAFEFSHQGQTVMGVDTLPWSFRNSPVKVGDQITILVNPTKPRRSIIFGTRRGVYVYAMLGMTPLSLMLAGAIFVQLRYVLGL
jgi:hypothetical protein